jgi:hypothetical protein
VRKIRVPHRDPHERLDAKSLWQLPNALDDPEERLVCRELLSRNAIASGCAVSARCSWVSRG